MSDPEPNDEAWYRWGRGRPYPEMLLTTGATAFSLSTALNGAADLSV